MAAEVIRADRQHRREADRRLHGVAPADPVPEPEHVGGVDAELRHFRGIGRDRDEVLRDRGLVASDARQRPLARGAGVGHRFQRREGLGRHDEERLRRIEIADRFGEVGAVDVRDEPEGEAAVAVVPERLVGHDRPEIGTADADVDDVADPLARVPGPGPAADAIGKVRHPVEHGMNLRHDVLAVDQDRRAARCAQRHVEHGAFLRDVDLLAAEHGVDAGAQAAVLGEADEQRERLVGDAVLRIIEIDARGLERQPFAALRIAREQLAEMHGADAPVVLFERLPGRLLGESPGAGSR